MQQLRPEVAALFELTTRSTYVHVIAHGRDYDLTKISVDEAEQLLALPGFDRLQRKPVELPEEVPASEETPANEVGSVAATTDPTRAKTKRKA